MEKTAMPLFSCIIPAYNVECYIEKCVTSLTNQSFSDIEIIIIDDGSTDNTMEIAYRLMAQHPCIKVFHQENSGQGAARNKGVAEASGEFVWFIDADDWVECDSLQYFASITEEYKPDVIWGNVAFYDEAVGYSSNPLPGHLSGRTLRPCDLPQEDLWDLAGWKMPPFRFLIQRKLLKTHNIAFPSGLFYEDHPFGLRVLHAAQRMYIAPLPTYVYYQRPGSTVRITNKRIFDFIPIRLQCLTILKEWGWDISFPQFYVSYLFPSSFYEHHVPDTFKKEFLEALKLERTEDTLRCLTHHQCDLVDNAKAFLWAVRYKAPWGYTLGARIKKALKPSMLRRYANKMIAAYFKLLFRFAKGLYKRLQGRAVQRHLLSCPSSVDIEECTIDVRVTDRNAPYIYADENAVLRGDYIFERGIGHLHIGWRTSIGGGCTIICSQSDGIKIGAQTMVSWGCTLMDTHAHRLEASLRCNDEWYWHLSEKAGCPGLFKDWTEVKSAPIVIEDRVWIGFKSIILGGVTVGEGAIVGAGSVVTKSVPPYTIYAGNPAHFIKLVPRFEGWNEKDLQRARAFGAPQEVIDAIENAIRISGQSPHLKIFTRPQKGSTL